MKNFKVRNVAATKLYEKLGFMKDERLARYYLNGGDAFRLKLWIDQAIEIESTN